MTAQPRVSIGLPVFNGEKYIRNTLDSFLAQELVDFELIISDNCSTDKTQDICREYALKDQRIKYHHSEINQGPIWNFNNVFQLASAEYFMWACHDDIFLESYLRVCVNVLDNDPRCVLAGTYTQSVHQDTGEIIFIDKGLTTRGCLPFKRYVMLKEFMYGGQCVGGIFCGVYRREAMKQLLPFYNLANFDQLHLLRVVLSGNISTVPEPLMIKRRGGTSQTYRNIAQVSNIKNPIHSYCPYFTLECFLQRYIFYSRHIPFIERLRISLFSFAHYCYTYARFLYWCMQGRARLFE